MTKELEALVEEWLNKAEENEIMAKDAEDYRNAVCLQVASGAFMLCASQLRGALIRAEAQNEDQNS